MDSDELSASGLGRYGGTLPRDASIPPILADYSAEAKYDLTTIARLVGVRPVVLHWWEQQYGVPAPSRLEDLGSSGRRYSERDLVAAMWLRDQIVNGEHGEEAIAKLRRQQGQRGRDGNTGNFGNRSSALSGGSAASGRLAGRTSGPLNASSPSNTAGPAHPSRPFTTSRPLNTSGPLSTSRPLNTSRPLSTSGPLHTSGPLSDPIRRPTYTRKLPELHAELPDLSQANPLGVRTEDWSRAVGNQPSNPSIGPTSRSGGPPSLPYFNVNSLPTGEWSPTGPRPREPHALLAMLVRAFRDLDTRGAHHAVNEALAARTVETVSVELLLPALQRVSEFSAHQQFSLIEHAYALNYVRAILFSALHRTPEREDGPIVFVGCGPRELNDVWALTLAVFWRRAGMRVIFLGQDLDAVSLVEECRAQRPVVVSLSVTAPQRLRSLAKLARSINQLPPPRPMFTFNGPIFVRNPELRRKVSGVYLGDDPATATFHLSNLLGGDHSL